MSFSWQGFTWAKKNGDGMYPGPNSWRSGNVWVDGEGLHLKISHDGGLWSCAEVTTERSLGFGDYEFQLTGRPDLFDRNVVLGLFNYPPNGPDGTNEIDIEFAQWGTPGNNNRLQWTVRPPAPGPGQTHNEVPISLNGSASTHCFNWTSGGVHYRSFHGYGKTYPLAEWNDAPSDPQDHIPHIPLPIHMNLWMFQGHPPNDGQPVEVVIRSFKFIPR